MTNQPNTIPETKREAETLTGKTCRQTNPLPQHHFMRCQIGTIVDMDEDRPIFKLEAFGRVWPEAFDMWQRVLANRKEFRL